ncbi:MAG: RagB/SusD family nutrient uptake outer membrane protein [Bacteroidales bacterium]|nr:RagB/SusD family nutrient uptake outer membrane protein [Bacteroidales bacterium]MDY6001983.1 RagB/SusD family nutrient uptake outer membrane protein [Candidatus Cryptobacteroides sp.]
MKTINILASLAFGLLAVSCNTLDISNRESYDESMVWTDANLATAYVNNLYSECFPNWNSSADCNSDQLQGIVWKADYITESGGAYKLWAYSDIRDINEAIARLEKSDLSKDVVNGLLGQVYFMRAYMYYWMVNYYGGIPYIKVPQDNKTDDLFVSRNTSAECFQFMVDDLDHAISLLPEKIEAESLDYGRIDQCFAKAWKAKTLLLKASPLFNPNNMYGNQYWKEAYAAAKDAYEFCVAHGIALTSEYSDIWLQEKGSEVVFAVINSKPDKVSGWASSTMPQSCSRGTNTSNPTWEFVKAFPMLDGKRFDDPTGKYYVADENALMQCFWKNRDPRFDEVITYNGREYPVAGKPSGYRQYNALGLSDGDDQYGTNSAAHVNAVNNDVYTGFYNYKAADLSLDQASVINYDIDFILMRLPEVMFIYAEAANETGHPDEAVEMLKEIRRRAGIEAGSDEAYGLDCSSREAIRQAINDERNIELCFEGHRFWDLRRTRNMMSLNGLTKHGLEAVAVNADGTDMDLNEAKKGVLSYDLTTEDFRYVLHQVPQSPNAEKEFVLKDSYYFFPIQTVRLQENKKLVQNIGWGAGSFDPTMR